MGESADEMVKLQLARSAAKVERPDAAADPSGRQFRRIIWAPKIFQPDDRPGGATLTRDPHAVLTRFGTECATDKIFGDDLGNFRLSMVSCLDQWKPKTEDREADAVEVEAAQSKAKVLLLHHADDRVLARGLRKALSLHNVEGVFPARDGDEVQRKSLDKSLMKTCDAIVICWGTTSETWTRAQANQLEDWRSLGREQNWEPRSVVLAPPPNQYKEEFKEDGPPSEIDQVIVVNDPQAIPLEEIKKLIPRRPAVEP